ncbi:MAG: BLUF domain-containing protein [Sulfuricurvum sp.]|nr:BLUF domain-containing protein [Sulfuricurvum sp.]
MKRLIYQSLASDDFNSKFVIEMLEKAVLDNKEKSITGILVYDGVQFLQCLEGEHDAIDELLIKIETDSRHHSVNIIGTEEDEKRLFSAWEMGYINYNEKTKEIIRSSTGSEILFPQAPNYEDLKHLLIKLSHFI